MSVEKEGFRLLVQEIHAQVESHIFMTMWATEEELDEEKQE